MSTATLEPEHMNWHARLRVDKYRPGAERDAMHQLFPRRARLIDKATARGIELPSLFLPHVSKAMYDELNIEPGSFTEVDGNLLTSAGIARLGSLLIGGGGQAYDSTHTAIGAGDTNTAAAQGNTDLAAAVNAANRWFQVADAANPTFAALTLTVVATFATGNGNFAWAEWGIAGNTSSAAAAATAPLLNRKVASIGTKTSSVPWVATATVAIS